VGPPPFRADRLAASIVSNPPLAKDGSMVFHESFQDNGATFDNGAT
jgi:hypothetical protein